MIKQPWQMKGEKHHGQNRGWGICDGRICDTVTVGFGSSGTKRVLLKVEDVGEQKACWNRGS